MNKKLILILPLIFGIFFFFLDFVLSHYGPSPFTFRLILWCIIQSYLIFGIQYYILIYRPGKNKNKKNFPVIRIISGLILSVTLTILVYLIFRILYPSESHNLANLKIHMIWITAIISFFESLVFLFLLQTMVYFREKTRLNIESEQLKQETYKAQFELLKTEINPHFLFNNFNTLYGLIQEDPKVASEYLLNFSQLYRYILNTKEQDLVSLNEEINTVKAYTYVLKKRYHDFLQIHYDIDKKYYEYQIIPLGLQILIENAIKHNQIDDEHTLNLSIKVSKNQIKVHNNFYSKKYEVESSGQGLLNLKNRYKLLSDKEVEIIKDNKYFQVNLPLIKPEK